MAAATPPSITATNAGNVTHPQVQLGGPVYVFLQVVGYATVIGAVAVAVDALRRPLRDYSGQRFQRWFWAGPQLLLLTLIAVSWLLSLTKLGGEAFLAGFVGFVAIYLFFCAMLQAAYLLVVVFPRRREPIPPEVEDELPKR